MKSKTKKTLRYIIYVSFTSAFLAIIFVPNCNYKERKLVSVKISVTKDFIRNKNHLVNIWRKTSEVPISRKFSEISTVEGVPYKLDRLSKNGDQYLYASDGRYVIFVSVGLDFNRDIYFTDDLFEKQFSIIDSEGDVVNSDFIEKRYDPTNGLFSRGDLWFSFDAKEISKVLP